MFRVIVLLVVSYCAIANAQPMRPATPAKVPPPPQLGVNVGLGLPHFVVFGLNYVEMARKISAEAGFTSVSTDVEVVRINLVHIDGALRYHPWAGLISTPSTSLRSSVGCGAIAMADFSANSESATNSR